jgi:predicted aspartyl protease
MRASLLALICLATVSSAARAEDCKLLKIASLPIAVSEDGRPLVPVAINGIERKFLVDTGGVFSAISAAIVKERGLHTMPIENMEIYSVTGEQIKTFVSVDTMKIGISTARHPHLMVVDLPPGVEGVLGPEYLQRFDLDFDFAGHALNLFSPEHCKGVVVYWTQEYVDAPFKLGESDHIEVSMTLDGRKLLALLDTGASDTLLSMGSARNLFGLKDGSPELELIPEAGEKDFVRYQHRFQSLSLDGVTVKNPLIYLNEDAAQRALNRKHMEKTQLDPQHRIELEKQDLLVGMNILSKLHLYIAYKEKMLYVSGANAH